MRILNVNMINILIIVISLSVSGYAQAKDKNLLSKKDTTVKPPSEWEELPNWAKAPENPVLLGIDECTNPLAIVNRANLLPVENCKFTDLVNLNSRGISSRKGLFLREIVIDDVKQLFDDAEKAGYPLVISTAWRNCEDQENIFQFWVHRGNGDENFANTYTYHCGASSHHLGTTIDILFKENGYVFGVHMEQTKTHAWLMDNIANYGCVKEYPKNKETLTGLRTEPWHFRCAIPKNAAKLIMSTDLTLAEWLVKNKL